jgi:hypothetical protein
MVKPSRRQSTSKKIRLPPPRARVSPKVRMVNPIDCSNENRSAPALPKLNQASILTIPP